MSDGPKLLMLIGAATPPGRLATAIAAAAAMARAGGSDVDILNLAGVPVEICDGRPLEAYGEATRRAVSRIAAASAVLVWAAGSPPRFPGRLEKLRDTPPLAAVQNKTVGIVAVRGWPPHSRAAVSRSV